MHWGRALTPYVFKWPEMIGRVGSYMAESNALLDF